MRLAACLAVAVGLAVGMAGMLVAVLAFLEAFRGAAMCLLRRCLRLRQRVRVAAFWVLRLDLGLALRMAAWLDTVALERGVRRLPRGNALPSQLRLLRRLWSLVM